MRAKVTDNTIVYIRFRKDLDDIITEAATKQGVPKATFVGNAMTEYITELFISTNGRFDSISDFSDFFSPLSSSFFAKKGRALAKNMGKPMRITLKKINENNIQLAAQCSGYTITQFRTAIMVTWLQKTKEL